LPELAIQILPERGKTYSSVESLPELL